LNLAEVVSASAAVSATRSRTAKAGHLAALLRGQPPETLRVVVPWLAGELHQGKIGIGWAAVSDALRAPPAAVSTLTVAEVDQALTALANLSGKGSAGHRREAMAALFALCAEAEQRFVAALLTGELRQGALDGVMLTGELRQGALDGVLVEAVASAASVPADAVRRAVMLSGGLVPPSLAALLGGEGALAAFRLEVMRPVQPMLAQTAEGVDEALELLGEARFEAKLDGARVQVHRKGSEVRIYTRALLPISLPEVAQAALALRADEVVLDGEALAFRPDGRPLAFQDTMRRFGGNRDPGGPPLVPFFFDVLHVDGVTVLDHPLHRRLETLERLVPEEWRVPSVRTSDPAVAAAFLKRTLDAGHEGVMAKGLDTLYEAGSRGAGWLKVKPAWTLDLVVLAVEWGSGRRQGLLSNLHLGARDPEHGGFVMLGKTFKGLTDELLAWQTRELLAREVRREGHVVHVRPELVVEIAFNDVQASSRYPGKVALRFARVKRYRPDKRPDEADTIGTVRRIFAGTAARAER
jgi:DNA ligase 1